MRRYKCNVKNLNNIILVQMPRSCPSFSNKTSINQQNDQLYQQFQYFYQDNTNYQSTQNSSSMIRSSEHELNQYQFTLLSINQQINLLDQGVSFYHDKLPKLRLTIDQYVSVDMLKNCYQIYQKMFKRFQLELILVKDLQKLIPEENINNHQQIEFRCELIYQKINDLQQFKKEILQKMKLLNQRREATTKSFRIKKGRSLSKLESKQMKTPEKAEKVQLRSSSEKKLCQELLNEMEKKSRKEVINLPKEFGIMLNKSNKK